MSGIKRIESHADAEGAQIFMRVHRLEPRRRHRGRREARERIDAIRDELPDELQRYTVQKFSTADQPVLQRAPGQRQQNLTGAYDLLDREIKRPLERIPGVARVEISGAPPNEVRDRDRRRIA